jgi:hypothetical protein
MNVQDFLDKIHKLDPKRVFFLCYIFGVFLTIIQTQVDINLFVALFITLMPMFFYGVFCYTYKDKANLTMIADSAYFLGFLFTLTSISASLFTFPDSADGTFNISRVINIFGFALASTIIGLLIKILLISLQPSVNDIIDNVRGNLQQTVSLFDTQLQLSLDRFKRFDDRMLELEEQNIENLTSRMDIIITQFTEQLNGLSEENREHLIKSLAESKDAIAEAVKNIAIGIQIPNDLFSAHLIEPMKEMKLQIDSFNKELTKTLKSQTKSSEKSEQIAIMIATMAEKIDVVENLPDISTQTSKYIENIENLNLGIESANNKIHGLSLELEKLFNYEKEKVETVAPLLDNFKSDMKFFKDFNEDIKASLVESNESLKLLQNELTNVAELIIRKLS